MSASRERHLPQSHVPDHGPRLKGTPEVSCPRGLSVPRPTAPPQWREGFTGGKGWRGRGGSTHPGTPRTRDSGGPTAVLQRGSEARQLIPQTPQRGGHPLLSGPRPGSQAWEATLFVVPKWGCIRAWRLPPALPPSPPAWPPLERGRHHPGPRQLAPRRRPHGQMPAGAQGEKGTDGSWARGPAACAGWGLIDTEMPQNPGPPPGHPVKISSHSLPTPGLPNAKFLTSRAAVETSPEPTKEE